MNTTTTPPEAPEAPEHPETATRDTSAPRPMRRPPDGHTPVLRFTPYAMAKLLWMRDRSDNEFDKIADGRRRLSGFAGQG